MELTDRDFNILKLVNKFRFCLGKHIMVLAGFTGRSATDRRLKLLIEAEYLTRRKYMYGVQYLYTLTHKGRILLGSNKRQDKIRIDRIAHDIYVLDAVIYYVQNFGLSLADIESEKELHIKDGFGARKHQADFAIKINGERIAVEVELNPKTKTRMEQNIRDNYMNYDGQVWITQDNRVLGMLNAFSEAYSGISILPLEKVLSHAK